LMIATVTGRRVIAHSRWGKKKAPLAGQLREQVLGPTPEQRPVP
jgi:hypothetical protein